MIWKITLALITAMLMLAPLGCFYHVANAQSSSKKSSNCEGDVCHTTVCINNNCQTSVPNPPELLNSMAQSHGLLSNSIQQLLNSPNPWQNIYPLNKDKLSTLLMRQYNHNYNSEVVMLAREIERYGGGSYSICLQLSPNRKRCEWDD